MQATDRGQLQAGDFSFFGFEALAPAVAETLAPLRIRGGEPAIVTIEDAVYVPTVEVAPHEFRGGLLTGEGQPIPQALAERRKSRWGSRVLGALPGPVTIEPRQVIDDEVVYLGWYFDHFGHFLLESLARTWVLPEIGPLTKVVFHTQRQSTLTGVARAILELLGIGPERVLIPQIQTRFRRVIVPEPLYEIAHAAHRRMPEPYRRIASRFEPHDAATAQPLYLSRRLLSSRQRAIVGELAMEEVMRENGFLVAHPETMTLEDQIRLVNRHPDVFTSAGSAAYLPLFAARTPRLHLLTAGVPFPDYFLAPAGAGFDTHYVNCLTGGDRLSVHYAPLRVEMDRFADYIDFLGLLQRRLRASLAIQTPDQPDAYEEAWLYRYLMTEGRQAVLPAAIAAEAARRAETSWPVSWALARHYLGQDQQQVARFAERFTELVTSETGLDRLAHYHDDIARGLTGVLHQLEPDLADRLTRTVRQRLLIDPAEEERRLAERRRARQAVRPNRDRARSATAS